ncbi:MULTISPECIES: LpxL/LpxP family Kdo(2)-lipid IV(A) lauroyl/palmitoleoyl acyltransferase [unclassified Colwellia]|uniref:LpxL/LpxP family Kdo(2)-lipid IV(A) lauroyl/palmitoleoyl acyltransferase n=1 Tax=unclassified Colwellia TaxID=196834 RepID=UPI0015F5D5CF|nr:MULTISPECIES: LpxL/LpxP family Kdo(2)-lipid IV(A) lauroyl/palmitoleoyl acyltransferase [unclassified Colwellia]MBA6351616.1 LpxL/LpxP family Kdo(2)-lipid IV(A) lauroyl/palmitoleoyl acyltransferase [Colwellia sp. BRX9-1]MBA6356563.1 LpxL/LpxP family Kdo(2)-lipid IV(A) lauroyl/palmitoleoyl acyltransferase [Colwellia sp. BRX8-3]MBA6359349.1 LpxL/LpxP family Kdo(2)-lipid IV(A) lauroyl/palmitoleoyl acyltransferase [Colwellia sp. BRX8-6]MBA6367961.1 LpxL/LpxP family Kdo(2)-lipid IV(A) lauroyl/palm
MSKNKVLQPDFKISFLLPKYWLTWFGVIVLYTISWLPYKLQLMLGRMLGRLLYKIGSSRKTVAMKNLQLCFPEMSAQERTRILKKNFENTGIALFETGMGWWWPDWRVRRKTKIVGLEHLEKAHREGKGVLLLTMHYLSVEINCRGMGTGHPTVVFYRPHNNQLMEFFQFRGRGRSNKYMLGKRDVKGLMKALRDKEVCIYLPDQDYGRNRSLFVPFFAVPDAATTTGTLIFARQKNVQSHILIPTRNDDGSGYTLEIKPMMENFPTDNDEADVIRINQELEKAIMFKPEQYMWLHRRFKTRPNEGDPSLYK